MKGTRERRGERRERKGKGGGKGKGGSMCSCDFSLGKTVTLSKSHQIKSFIIWQQQMLV